MLRIATEDDRDDVVALAIAEEAAWFGAAESSSEEVAEWLDDEGGVASGVVAADGGGLLHGFASAGRQRALFVAEPASVAALSDLLVPWLREQCDHLELMTFAGDRARTAAFERHGLRALRSTFELLRPAGPDPLPRAEFPADVAVVPYSLGEDDAAVYRLIYEDAAWGDVPGHVVRDLDGWRATMLPCSALFVARRADRPVGMVAGRVLDSGRGFVTKLAVARGERGRGLGRALLLHAFAELEREGARGLALGVEAANAAALGLYRSVGLEIEREWRTFGTEAG